MPRLLLTLVFLFTSPARATRPALVTQYAIEAEPVSENVENGRAFELGVFEWGEIKEIRLPPRFTVDFRPPGKPGVLALKKSVHFKGHPPQLVSIRSGRQWLGCALKRDGAKVSLATFGEWNSEEGRAVIAGRVAVPEGVKVTRDATLAGPHSAAQGKEENPSSPQGYWYAPRSPAAGWTAIATDPDARHRFEQTLNKD